MRDSGRSSLILCSLSVLDLSFNLLRHVPESIQYLPSLEKVFFVQNKISHISGLDRIGQTLRSFELGGNRIRVSLHSSLYSTRL